MSALQRLFGRDDKFYLLLETSAAEAQNGTVILGRLLDTLGQSTIDTVIGDLDQCRRKHKRISQEITEALFATFVTPLEREDIEAVSAALYKITKTIEKIGERLTICPPGLSAAPLRKQISLLDQAAGIVVKMVGELRSKSHGTLIRDHYERVQAIEGDADRVMNELLRELYHGQADARTVVFLKDIYELLEKGVDRCRDVSALLFHIVLKGS
jgi:uncharacterized protein